MSDENWRFGIDDFGPDTNGVDVADTSEEDNTETSGGSVRDVNNPLKAEQLVLIPLWALAIYAFTAYQPTVAALTALFGGAATIAKVVASAFAVVGGVTVTGFALVGVLTVTALLVGLYKRDALRLSMSFIGFVLIGGAWYISTILFSHLPVLVIWGIGVPIVGMYLSMVASLMVVASIIGALAALATVFLL